MRVLIVAKTRMGKGACIGGISSEGHSLRLVAADAETNEIAGREYNVGEVWQIKCRPAAKVIPPHVENVIVHDKKHLPKTIDPIPIIERFMPPCSGGIEALYEGLTQATKAGALYIAERTGVPPYSTTFWIPDRPLQREVTSKRIRYRYPTNDGGRTITFVGFQEPVEVIEPGTLLRVSLAHWWRPEEKPDGEYRCYVQLSGWFMPGDACAAEDRSSKCVASSVTDLPSRSAEANPRDILQDVFGYDDFWPLQAEIIDNILRKKDSLAIMPTGGGKSLCYQLPALIFEGLTVVVSPLISLMQDQVDQLHEWGIPAVFLNSFLGFGEYIETTRRLRQGAVKLLYLAPETLLRPETLLLLEGCRVDCLTIDEAHCISSWGHDFRPDYRQLMSVRQRFPSAVCFALTATATPRVRQDIKEQLAIEDADEFIGSFNRKNLFLEVLPKIDGCAQLLSFLEDRREQSGIIYCATRRQVDELSAELQEAGWSVLPYHAGLDTATRQQHQTRFSRDDVQIMVATVAFGMGIDKSNVRFVVHYDLPKDIESYYQEIGRAGRDGLRADCILFFSYGDVHTIKHFIEKMEVSERRGANLRLGALIRYADSKTCRRKPLLKYFGEPYDAVSCAMCDNCQSEEKELVDMTVQAQMFLSCVKRTGERFGITYTVDVLRGSKAKRILQNRHDKVSTYGIGRDYTKKEWTNMAHQFIEQGLLIQDMDHGGLKLTPSAHDVFRGKMVMGAPLEKGVRHARSRKETPKYDAALFELLRNKRKELADAAGVPPFV
ncbi:MAG: DNA helicase RecQ, partial [Chloroflexota bacterium]